MTTQATRSNPVSGYSSWHYLFLMDCTECIGLLYCIIRKIPVYSQHYQRTTFHQTLMDFMQRSLQQPSLKGQPTFSDISVFYRSCGESSTYRQLVFCHCLPPPKTAGCLDLVQLPSQKVRPIKVKSQL